MMFVMFLGMLINSTINFRNYGLVSVENKAKTVAQSIKHGLTAHMINGVMDKRLIFLNELKNLPDIEDIWIVRGKSVIEQYGKGLYGEGIRDDIDKLVIEKGVIGKEVNEHIFSKSSFRITIPYTAEITPYIDCTKCHNAKIGDTLGAISMVINIDDLKAEGMNDILINALIAVVLIVVILIIVNFTISPYVEIFDSITKTMKATNEGDYSLRVEGGVFEDTQEVAKWINSLLNKINNVLKDVETKIQLFLNQKKDSTQIDPLLNVKFSIDRLGDIYKFRKTIELDANINEVYGRMGTVLTDKFHLNHFNFLEINTAKKITRNSFGYGGGLRCSALKNGCRAYLTNSLVDSSQFKDLCSKRNDSDGQYLCIPYAISHDLDFVLNIETDTIEEHRRVRDILPLIRDYIETAQPEIVSKNLMEILRESARTDPLTGLFNRKYLEENISSVMSQAQRGKISYGILMCDIDYFKMVNDTYGHDIGDKLIRVIANTLKENTRDSDIVIRYGGEEFLILLYNCDAAYVEKVAQKIRVEFSKKKINAGYETFSKTISIGASIYPNNDNNLWKCIKFADVALYEAKEKGRNRVVLFNENLLKKHNIGDKY